MRRDTASRNKAGSILPVAAISESLTRIFSALVRSDFKTMVGPAAVTVGDRRERSYFPVVDPHVGVHSSAEQGVELFVCHSNLYF